MRLQRRAGSACARRWRFGSWGSVGAKVAWEFLALTRPGVSASDIDDIQGSTENPTEEDAAYTKKGVAVRFTEKPRFDVYRSSA